MNIQTITANDLNQRLQAGDAIDLIDVRTAGEFARVHVPRARNLPLNSFDAAAILAQRDEQAPPLALICHSGQRAQSAADQLRAVGCQEVLLVSGGTLAWQQAGLPVNRGKGTLPLDRQMQMTVGVLIVVGAVLAYTVHIGWLALPAAIGLGLFNAGLTGICPLAMVLAAMPWNRGSGCVTSCALPANDHSKQTAN